MEGETISLLGRIIVIDVLSSPMPSTSCSKLILIKLRLVAKDAYGGAPSSAAPDLKSTDDACAFQGVFFFFLFLSSSRSVCHVSLTICQRQRSRADT